MGFSDEFIPAQQVGTAQNLTTQQGDLLRMLLGQTLEGVQEGPGIFPGETVAGVSPVQSQAFGSVQNLLSGGVPQANQALESVLGGTQQVPGAVDVQGPTQTAFDPQATQDFFQQSLLDPAMKAFEEDIIPRIQESFIGQNAGRSGAANRAVAGAGADLASDLSAQLGSILFQSREAQTGREFGAGESFAERSRLAQESAAGREFGAGQSDLNRILQSIMPALAAELGPAELGLTAGAQQRGIAQEQLGGEQLKFQQQQPFANPFLAQAFDLLGINAQSPILQQAQIKQGIGSALIPALGQIGASAAKGAFSNPNFKFSNIFGG